MSATTILNEIMSKFSKLTEEEKNPEQLSEVEVTEEEVLEPVNEATEKAQEQATDLSENSTEEETKISEVEASEEPVEAEEEVSLMKGYVSEEKYMADMGAMKAEIQAIKKMIDEEMGYMKKEKEALSEQVKELSKQPAAESIKHSPEEKTKPNLNLYAQSRPMTTADKVFQRISSIKK